MKKMIIELLFALPLIAGGVACGSDEEPAAPIENKQYKVLPHTTSMEVRWKDAAGVVRFCVDGRRAERRSRSAFDQCFD